MSKFGADPSYHKTRNVETVSGRILGGSGTASKIKGSSGWSLTYVSTGTYKITTDVNYPFIVGGGGQLMSASHQYQVTVSAYVQGTTAGTSVTLQVTNAGTPTDISSTEELWFSFDFARTVVP